MLASDQWKGREGIPVEAFGKKKIFPPWDEIMLAGQLGHSLSTPRPSKSKPISCNLDTNLVLNPADYDVDFLLRESESL